MTTDNLNKILASARMCIGALRQYAPEDTIRSINEILYTLAQAQYEHGKIITPEGRGHTDITAREDLQIAVALAYAALNVETTEAPF
jgi:hypothetical protein